MTTLRYRRVGTGAGAAGDIADVAVIDGDRRRSVGHTMTGQQPVQRTRQDKIRDWMTLLFAVAVIAGLTGALMAWPRAFGVATVAMIAAAILTAAYFIAGPS